MKTPRHAMILASAGSGKTFALTNRYIALLAGGAPPERIVALTFTRKAAGEFFDEILKKLARAAGSPEAAARLGRELAQGPDGADGPLPTPADYLRLLRQVVDAMPRLSLGTLDSFFARVVRGFPLELGLSGDFTLLEGAAAARERRQALGRLFAAADRPTPAQREFIEAFKRATFGGEEKRLTERIERFIDGHTQIFLDAPEARYWGRADRIWPAGCAWLQAVGRREAALGTLRATLPWDRFNDKQRARLDDFFAALPDWAPGAELPKPVTYLVGNAFKVWDDLQAGRAELTLERKKILLPPACQAALVKVVSGLGGAELERRLTMTGGIFEVVRGYEENYHDSVRRAGRLTFADITRLLGPAKLARDDAEAAADGRLLVDWRLDAQFDHWLLDEFQDTSHAQWNVLRNLIDEAVQDPEGRRSFFYVGDVKQSIYVWRQGDPRLFREIFDHYNAVAAGTIAEGHLTDSWRSGPPAIAMVNRVFGDETAQRALLPPAAVARWTREWRRHGSARPEMGGWAELRHAEDEAGRFAVTLAILLETRAQDRGLSVAVLVQRNDTAAKLADFLRQEGGLLAVAESDLHVATDNPLTCALMALLQAAAHPGDRFAREHLRMTPLWTALEAAGLTTEDALTGQILQELHATGVAGTLARWLGRLEPYLAAGDDFSRRRGRQLVELGRQFDEDGRRDVAEFLAAARAHAVRDAEAANAIRVMTIHKAKGLGFDLVILSDLEGKKLAQRREGLAIHRAADRAVEWILDLPSAPFADGDPILAAQIADEEADAAYEALCLLYVAMTRAKRAMYLVTEPVGETSTSRNYPKLLEQTLGDLWSEGDAAWYDSLPLTRQAGPGEGPPGLEPLAGAAGGARLVARRPSGEQRGAVGGALLFSLENARGAERGTAVHALLAEVEWLEPGAVEKLAAAWRARGEDAAAVAEALTCLRSPGLAEVWTKPPGPAGLHEAWRERRFETVLDGVWITGTFDRVVVARDARGRAERAAVFDFKTDAAPDPTRHRGQLALYRQAAMQLTGLTGTAVGAELVFTSTRTRAAAVTAT